MTDAPEHIWAMAPHIGEFFADPPVNEEDKRFLTEYIRADLAQQWQPIETAPKDGTVFDAWCSDYKGMTDAPKRIPNCRYTDGVLEYRHSHGWFPLNSYEWSHATITRWMPLPNPPEAK